MKLALSLLALTAALASAPAAATNSYNRVVAMTANAANVCHTALPQFDNPIRFRPLAVANEGNKPAFVTCAFSVDANAINSLGGARQFSLQLRNQSNVSQTFACTGVVGSDADGPTSASYYAKTLTLPAGGTGVLDWVALNYGETGGWNGQLGVSCALQPGGAITETNVSWSVQDKY